MDQKYIQILKDLNENSNLTQEEKILLVDGMNTFIRNFSLIKAINPDGDHIGGIVGFLKSLGYLVRTLKPTKVICVFDGKNSSINRKNVNPNYKSQRQLIRVTNYDLFENKQQEYQSLINQVERVKDYLECLPIYQLTLDKLEADDIIAYLAKHRFNDTKTVIVSSDKDFLQLVDKNTEVFSPRKRKEINLENILNEISVPPQNYVFVKALLGDTSDNLTGIKGLGIKTLLKKFDFLQKDITVNLQMIYNHCEKNLKKHKIYAQVIHEWLKVQNNYELMNLHKNILSKSEIKYVDNVIKTPCNNLTVGPFLSMLDKDKIYRIVNNTENWLQTFTKLTLK